MKVILLLLYSHLICLSFQGIILTDDTEIEKQPTLSKENIDLKSGYKIESAYIYNLYEKLKTIDKVKRSEIEGLKERGDIILAGLIPYIATSKKITSKELILSDSGVRDGILYAILNDILDVRNVDSIKIILSFVFK